MKGLELGLITSDLYCLANHPVDYHDTPIDAVSFDYAPYIYDQDNNLLTVDFKDTTKDYTKLNCYWLNPSGIITKADKNKNLLFVKILSDTITGRVDKTLGFKSDINQQAIVQDALDNQIARLAVKPVGAHFWTETQDDGWTYDESIDENITSEDACKFIKDNYDAFDNIDNQPVANAFEAWDMLPIQVFVFNLS